MIGTISQGERACWIVHDDRGEFDGDGDRVTHFATEAKATEYLSELERDGLRVVENAAPCFTAVAVCGYVYDEDGEGIEHYPDAESLADILRCVDWTTTADGRWLCHGDACVPCFSLRFPEGEDES